MKPLTSFETTYTEDLYQIPAKVTIALDRKWKEVSAEEKELLTKILGALKLSLAAVRITNVEKLELSTWKDKPKKLIGFGLSIQGVATYELIATPETQLVLADSLTELLQDDGLKKKLWACLRQLFTL